MVASNRNQMIFSYNNSIMVSNSHNLQLDQSIIRWQQSWITANLIHTTDTNAKKTQKFYHVSIGDMNWAFGLMKLYIISWYITLH